MLSAHLEKEKGETANMRIRRLVNINQRERALNTISEEACKELLGHCCSKSKHFIFRHSGALQSGSCTPCPPAQHQLPPQLATQHQMTCSRDGHASNKEPDVLCMHICTQGNEVLPGLLEMTIIDGCVTTRINHVCLVSWILPHPG